jgi:hypothetical protein
VVLDGNRRLVGLDVATHRIAARNVRCLHIVTAITQVLHVQHIVADLVFCVDGCRVKRIDQIHWRIEQAVPPGQSLSTNAYDRFFTRVSKSQAIKTMQDHVLAAVPDDVCQVEQATVVIWQPWKENIRTAR